MLRSCLFIAVLLAQFVGHIEMFTYKAILPVIVWVFFIGAMCQRFFPSRLESMGCQKQFKRNYESKGEGIVPANQSWKRTALVAAVWFALNGLWGILYYLGVFDKGILMLISVAYSVCDIICILFFCPFQTWFMKNRCCTTCRIYNWDFAMMFTPLVFIPSIYTYSLLGFAVALLLRWEITYKLHPERFSTETNKCLDCSRCEEKLCSHKKQLQGFIKKNRSRFFPTHKN
ncbi:MAG: hypothetical protein IKU19_03280 [Clostridia bacterium]|nr:hypothetical protein [Clostridia bacterium]